MREHSKVASYLDTGEVTTALPTSESASEPLISIGLGPDVLGPVVFYTSTPEGIVTSVALISEGTVTRSALTPERFITGFSLTSEGITSSASLDPDGVAALTSSIEIDSSSSFLLTTDESAEIITSSGTESTSQLGVSRTVGTAEPISTLTSKISNISPSFTIAQPLQKPTTLATNGTDTENGGGRVKGFSQSTRYYNNR